MKALNFLLFNWSEYLLKTVLPYWDYWKKSYIHFIVSACWIQKEREKEREFHVPGTHVLATFHENYMH